jgi:putative component of toxin-antitoxin plasmid stabilization module
MGELRNHGAALNRALNEALRIHGGPAWRVFQVRCLCLFLFFLCFCARSLQHDAYGF